ncbi:Sas10/Utp3/C1D family-domain-containing protein [Amylocarpus encephaloides]|uniref:Exosome complex protein n=1 Tax=Amylocarpus encephaloides TaxID=45428 RepID=A0A9P7Y9X4_9HELO|nr:Sas10/Utp3/C1D family-domain-containing protein [Amylocarpus encephaloides]
MDSSNVLVLLEQLDDEVDDLEESLGPLIKTALSETTSKLPLLDKAKLFVLVTYAIESVLFSYLRLNGVNAREHPVFIELTRVKQYFDKIKSTEPAAPRTSTLDKAAAARFVNPSLASAEKEALKQAEIRAKERARAHIKFDELSKNIAEKGKALKQKAGQGNRATDDGSSSSDSSSLGINRQKKRSPYQLRRNDQRGGRRRRVPPNEVALKAFSVAITFQPSTQPLKNLQRRSGGGSRAPSRPTAAPQRPAPQQQRPATTAAHPPANTRQTTAPPATPAAQQSAGPGLFGQMASTAAGVAVGSSIGHAIGGFFGGGSSQAVAEPAQDNNAVASQDQQSQNNWGARSCETDAKQFTKCLDENQGNMQICGWYLEQLKACQSAASQY